MLSIDNFIKSLYKFDGDSTMLYVYIAIAGVALILLFITDFFGLRPTKKKEEAEVKKSVDNNFEATPIKSELPKDFFNSDKNEAEKNHKINMNTEEAKAQAIEIPPINSEVSDEEQFSPVYLERNEDKVTDLLNDEKKSQTNNSSFNTSLLDLIGVRESEEVEINTEAKENLTNDELKVDLDPENPKPPEFNQNTKEVKNDEIEPKPKVERTVNNSLFSMVELKERLAKLQTEMEAKSRKDQGEIVPEPNDLDHILKQVGLEDTIEIPRLTNEEQTILGRQ